MSRLCAICYYSLYTTRIRACIKERMGRVRSLQITDWCHEIFERFVPAGGVYIDATMGQGQDTLFLCRLAGEEAGRLTAAGALFLDPEGELEAGIPLCPPEGDAGTGMAATNSVAVRTGNVSAGTSVFAMAVLEKELSRPYEEIDLVTTPSGDLVAMVHCNNCTSDLNAWAGLFREFADCMGMDADMDRIFSVLYNKALEGDADCGGLLAYNYFSGEHITGFEEGRPLFVRSPESRFDLPNFMRVHLYTSLGALKTGMDILLKKIGLDPKKEICSADGGIRAFPKENRFIVISPKTETLTLQEPSGTAKNLSITGNKVFSTYSASAMDNKPLEKSRRILILHITDVKNGKNSYKMYKDKLRVYGWGGYPLLLRKAKAQVSLKNTAEGIAELYAIDITGKRLNSVPFTEKNGVLIFTADNTLGDTPSIGYELIRK